MQIPLYQIKNILELYSRQLSLNGLTPKNLCAGNDSVHMGTSEGKRKAVLDQVISRIMDRILSEKPSQKNKIIHGIQNNPERSTASHLSKNNTQFTYSKMDENHQITTHSLPLEDSRFFVKRIMKMNAQVSDNIAG